MTQAKVTLPVLRDMKARREPITWLTAYDYPTAQAMDQSGIDMILVGDSLGMTVLGYETTLPVTMDGEARSFALTRIHVEEDAGKSSHDNFALANGAPWWLLAPLIVFIAQMVKHLRLARRLIERQHPAVFVVGGTRKQRRVLTVFAELQIRKLHIAVRRARVFRLDLLAVINVFRFTRFDTDERDAIAALRVADFGARRDVFGEGRLGDVVGHDGALRASC